MSDITIKIKRGSTGGVIPSGLTFGELAVNVTDALLYVGGTTGETILIGGGGGGGSGGFTGATGATGATGPTGAIPSDYVISFNGSTGAITFVNYVSSLNGSTGAITNVARTNEGNTFSIRQVMNAGVTTSTLFVSSGTTLNGRAYFGGTATFDSVS